MAWQTIDGELVLLNIDGKELLGVNPTGARVWALIDGKRQLREIVQTLASDLEIDESVARRDVRAFLAELRAAGAVD